MIPSTICRSSILAKRAVTSASAPLPVEHGDGKGLGGSCCVSAGDGILGLACVAVGLGVEADHGGVDGVVERVAVDEMFDDEGHGTAGQVAGGMAVGDGGDVSAEAEDGVVIEAAEDHADGRDN